MFDLLHETKPYLEQYGYWAVFGGVMLESFGVPMPGETLLIAASLLAAKGDMHPLPILLCAWLGAVLGDNIGYGIGRFGGRLLVLKYGRFVFLTERRLGTVEEFFRRHGGSVVMVARFIEGLRQFNGLVAGIANMAWSRFLAYNAAGAALWVCCWGLLAYLFGARTGPLATWLALGISTVLAGGAGFWILHRRRGSKKK